MSTWQALDKAPKFECAHSLIVKNPQSSIYCIGDGDIIYEYCNKESAWNKIYTANKLSRSFVESVVQAASVDVINNKIYVVNGIGSMAILDMTQKETMRWEIIELLMDVNDGSQGIMIKNEFHTIGGYHYNVGEHAVYNHKTKNFNPRLKIIICF